jgi:hypothetical protein
MRTERPCPPLVDGRAGPIVPLEQWKAWTLTEVFKSIHTHIYIYIYMHLFTTMRRMCDVRMLEVWKKIRAFQTTVPTKQELWNVH